MKRENWNYEHRKRVSGSRRIEKIMKCFRSGEQLRAANEMVPSSGSQSLATNEYITSGYSAKADEVYRKPDTGNIEEAESSLRESGYLNYEEARALLGRYEYQKGNIEAALHVFEGIDIVSVAPKMKVTLAKRGEGQKRHSRSNTLPPLSIHAVGLLLEAEFLKAKSLQALQRFREASQSCKFILDVVESSLPGGLPEDFGVDCKLQETLNKAVELLPELWKFANSPHEAISSYRRALLYSWNLDAETMARIQKEFAIFLLYGGVEASPLDLRSQIDSSFVPKNNIEEAVLLLMILLRKVSLRRIEWDPSILDHLSFALSIAGDLKALANQFEELIPVTRDQKEIYFNLALCYYGAGDGLTALNLLRKLFKSRDDPNYVLALLMASKICGKSPNCAEEGMSFAYKAIESLQGGSSQMVGIANCLLGVSLSAHSKSAMAESERAKRKDEALSALVTAARLTNMEDSNVLYHLSLENAEQRRLEPALYYAKCSLKLDGGSDIRGWILLARILSAQKRFVDAETLINAALDQTGKWDQGELLRTKAKLQILQGHFKNANETYTQLLALLHVLNKRFNHGKKLKANENSDKILEVETWNDLAHVYISQSQWRDVEICLSRSEAITPYSASRCHTIGKLHEAKGSYKEALGAFVNALDIEPTHVPTLISMAVVLRRLGDQSNAVARSLLMDALRLDRMNHSAWFNLGLLYRDEGPPASAGAAECFEAAAFLEESAPVEPFR